MSDRPIQVGDLVAVVRPNTCDCAASRNSFGRLFHVAKIDVSEGGSFCMQCDKVLSNKPFFFASDGGNRNYGMYRLKRIPPLEELEGVRTEENLKEPA